MNRPSINHSILSPSGRVSKLAREAALKREHDKLFPPGYWDTPAKTPTGEIAEKAERLIAAAANLRALAARGMSTRKYLKAAERMEAEAWGLTR